MFRLTGEEYVDKHYFTTVYRHGDVSGLMAHPLETG